LYPDHREPDLIQKLKSYNLRITLNTKVGYIVCGSLVQVTRRITKMDIIIKRLKLASGVSSL